MSSLQLGIKLRQEAAELPPAFSAGGSGWPARGPRLFLDGSPAMRYRETSATSEFMPRKKDPVLDRWRRENSVVDSLVKKLPLCNADEEELYTKAVRTHLSTDGPDSLCDLADGKGRTLLWHATRELDDKAIHLLLKEGNMGRTVSRSTRSSSSVDPVALALELGRQDLADMMLASCNAMVVRHRGSLDKQAVSDRDLRGDPGASFFFCCAPAQEDTFAPAGDDF